MRRPESFLLSCPICDGPSVVDNPRLAVVDATCQRCGWHFTSPLARERLAAAERSVAAAELELDRQTFDASAYERPFPAHYRGCTCSPCIQSAFGGMP